MQICEYSDERLRQLASRAPSGSKPEDLKWILPALQRFRQVWRGRPTEAAATLGVARGTICRWLYDDSYPGKHVQGAFRKACQQSGIEVRL